MWRQFLAHQEVFPFPDMSEDRYANSADISFYEASHLAPEWKAEFAVQDETLIQKLCDTLDGIMGDTLLSSDSERVLLSSFGRRLECRTVSGREVNWAAKNDSEFQISKILTTGLLAHSCDRVPYS